MAKYSTSSRDNEAGLTEWEMRMAKLVGLDDSTPPDREDASITDITDITGATQSDELSTNVTQQPLSANPFAKAGLVGAGTLAVVMFAGGFLSQIMSNDNSQLTQNAIVKTTPTPPPTKPRLQQLETQVEELKTKLALSEQLEAVKTAQQKLRMTKPTPPTQKAVKPIPQPKPRNSRNNISTSTTRMRPKPQTPQVRIVEVPKIVRVEVPVAAPKPVAQKPLPIIPETAPPPPPPQPIVEIAPPSPPNPMQEWTRLAKLGSYGQVSLNENQAVSNRTSSEQASEKIEFARETKQREPQTQIKTESQTPTARQSTRRNPKTALIGTSARAVLATAIYGETTKSSREETENSNVYLLQLKQPLKAADGTAALPVGSQILTKVDSISENGLMQLAIVKIRMRENGKFTEKTVPQDGLTIRGKAGKPLIANQYPNNGSSIARMDAGLFALGGLGKAAELINRTESEVVTGENGTVAVTNVNRDPSMAAGILEGGMKSVVPQISRRNQRAISQMSRKTNIWFLPPGKEVEIFVNQEMQF